MSTRKKILETVVILCDSILFDGRSEEESDEEEISHLTLSIINSNINYYARNKSFRIKLYIEKVICNYTCQEFQCHFRLSRNAYETLLNVIGPRIKRISEVGRKTIDPDKQLLSVLWLLTTPDSYRSVGERFVMGKASLSTSFMRVISALAEISSTIINWPNGEKLMNTVTSFSRMAGVPNVVGCIDGTNITIKASKKDPETYITRKCTYAITLQAICDANLKFTDVFVGYPGSVSDTRIFRN